MSLKPVIYQTCINAILRLGVLINLCLSVGLLYVPALAWGQTQSEKRNTETRPVLSTPSLLTKPLSTPSVLGPQTAPLQGLENSGGAAVSSGRVSFDERHKTCLERIALDAELAFEEAMIWRDHGGGRRARHCVAMSLFALGHLEEAAHRLDKLAEAKDVGSDELRVKYRSEAANFWLASELPDQAYASATEGLTLQEDHLDLRISRARAYAQLERFDYAEIDLTYVLAFEPHHAAALRYRADAHRRQGHLDAARDDVEAALLADPTSVESALLRGEIIQAQYREAQKLEKESAEAPPQKGEPLAEGEQTPPAAENAAKTDK